MLIECLPLCLFHFGKSFSFCVFLLTHLWYLGNLSSGFPIWINGRSLGPLLFVSAQHPEEPLQCPGFRFLLTVLQFGGHSWQPHHQPLLHHHRHHLLWRGVFACLDRCTPSPLAPGLGSAPGATGTHLAIPTSTAHPKHCFVCPQTAPLYGLHAQGVKSPSQQAGEQTQSTSEKAFFFPW